MAARPAAEVVVHPKTGLHQIASGRKLKGVKNEAVQKRQPGARGYLGTTDHLRDERQTIRLWAEYEEQCGHSLGRLDIFRQFKMLVVCKQQALLTAQAERGLTSEEEKALSFSQERLTAWDIGRKKDKAALNLLSQISFVERKTNRLTKLSYEEETARLHCSWQLYDYLIWLTAKGSLEDLKSFVARPEDWRKNWKQTVLLFTDQIPAWLKVEGGKQAVSTTKLGSQRQQQAARRDQRKQVKAGSLAASTAAQAAASDSYLTAGPGSTKASRYRITYCVRQAIDNFFDASAQPEGESIY